MAKLKNPQMVGELKIGHSKYKIILADKIYADGLKRYFNNSILGEIFMDRKDKRNNYIAIKKDSKNKQHILYHEVAHALMYEMARDKHLRFTALKILGDNEMFIDRLAKILQKSFLLKEIKTKGQIISFTDISMKEQKVKGGIAQK